MTDAIYAIRKDNQFIPDYHSINIKKATHDIKTMSAGNNFLYELVRVVSISGVIRIDETVVAKYINGIEVSNTPYYKKGK